MQRLAQIALAAFGLAVLVSQPSEFGLPRGHHGWVTAQHLAIVRNAHAGNSFVGYTGIVEREPEALEHFYFNRAPFVFEALAHPVLAIVDADTRRYVHWGRQLMNVVYLATAGVALGFLWLLLGDPTRAALATLAAFSGHWLIGYKDLFEQNRLGVLAFALVLFGSARLLLARDRRGFWLSVAIASCMGEAAPAVFALLVLNALLFLNAREIGGSGRSPSLHLRSPAFAALCASVLISLGAIGYNVVVEARIRELPVLSTGVVDSALRRTGTSAGPGSAVPLAEFGRKQWHMARRGLVPEVLYELSHPDDRSGTAIVWAERVAEALCIVLWLAGVAALVLWLRSERGARRLLIVLALACGPAYLLPMRGLAHFHDFTATYYLGLNLVFWAALLRGPKLRIRAVAVVALTGLSLWTITMSHAAATPGWPALAAEVDRARARIGRDAPRIHTPEGHEAFLEGVPYSLMFFFPDSILTSHADRADVIVTGRANHPGADLVPENRRVKVHAP